MKVLYTLAEKFDLNTVLRRGVIREDDEPVTLEGEGERITFENVCSVRTERMPGFGMILAADDGERTVRLVTPLVYLDVGSGRAIINYVAALRLRRILEGRGKKPRKKKDGKLKTALWMLLSLLIFAVLYVLAQFLASILLAVPVQ